MDHHNPQNVNAAHPPPTDFDSFLPWACGQLSVEVNVTIIRSIQSHYVSAVISRSKSKAKLPKPKPSQVPENISETETSSYDKTVLTFGQSMADSEKPIIVETIYDNHLHLVQLKFLKNRTIPRQIMQILGIIIPYHKHLNSITINSGLHIEAMYEISKFLPSSGITELCLDHTFLAEANYHILLKEGSLKHLSLSKCRINDAVVKTIASQLTYPCNASKKLSVLNLSTNRITDEGIKLLADALRSNRHLSYLNLADNMITDKGAISLLNILVEFPLTSSEIMERNERLMAYLKEKRNIILKTIKDIQNGELDKKTQKRKSIKPTVAVHQKSKILEKDSMTVNTKSIGNIDSLYTERAGIVAEGILGPYNDPFNSLNTVTKDNIQYCIGNYTLCYLNLAYNDLTYMCLRKLHEVLLTQQLISRRPKGLINVKIEGNFLPTECVELQQIDDLLETGLATVRRLSESKKKSPGSKSSR